ncbi:MAG: DUF4238 domain-containing protein [Erysipelotrichaceae bacterium]|nr:DUF4238 domain-containing protein [Erysipelotrichaceae bacterium]
MSNRRKQHYVPKEYLRAFSNDTKNISLYVIDKGLTVPRAPLSDQCYQNFFYGKDLLWEDKLAKLETQWGLVLSKLKDSHDYYPNSEERKLLQSFIIFQYYRTESYIDHATDNILGLESESIRMEIEKGQNVDLSGVTKKQLKSMILQNDPEHKAKVKQKVVQNSLSIASQIITEIDDLAMMIVNYKTTSNLISCDNPVIYINLYSPYHIGLTMAGLVIFLPLSPKRLLVFYDSKMYNQKNNILSISNDNEIKHLNTYHFIKAKNILIANNVSDFSFIEKNPCIMKFRQENKETSALSTFGTREDKIIHAHPPLCLYDCPLSFCKLPKKLSKIPLGVRDRFPRKYDQKWEYHFKLRLSLYKSIPEMNANRVTLQEANEINNFIFRYWRR